jgi:hypothetical protein
VQEQYQDYKDIDIAMKKFPRRRDLEEVCRDWKKAHEMVDGVRSAFNHATAERTGPGAA